MKNKYVCTSCGGDASVALRHQEIGNNYNHMIKPGERICLHCAKVRGIKIGQDMYGGKKPEKNLVESER